MRIRILEVTVFQASRLDDTCHVGTVVEHFQDLCTGHLANDGCIAEGQDGEHVSIVQ